MGDLKHINKGPSWKGESPATVIAIAEAPLSSKGPKAPRRKESSIVFQARVAAAKTWLYYPLVAAQFGLSITECVLVGYGTTGGYISAQIAILAVSSFFWVLLVVYTALHMEITPKRGFLRNLGLVLFTLRCFRTVRQFWHFESVPIPPHELQSDYQPTKHFFNLRISSRLAIQYLERIGVELFSARSRGGAVIIALFFFVTYVLAVVFSSRKGELKTPQGQPCVDVKNCFFTLMRLAFYDGTGFDYMQAVADNDQLDGYTFLLFFYMIFNGIVLVNGLIAIFGAAFNDKDGDMELQRLHSTTTSQNSEVKKLIDASGQELWTMLSVSIQQGHSLRSEISEMKKIMHDKGLVGGGGGAGAGPGSAAISTANTSAPPPLVNLGPLAAIPEFVSGTKYRVWLFDPAATEVRVVRLTREQFRFSSMQHMLQADSLEHLPLYIKGDYSDVLCLTFDGKPLPSAPYNEAAAQFFKHTGLSHRFLKPHGRFIMFHQVRAADEDVLEDMSFSVAEVAALWKSRGAAVPSDYRKPVEAGAITTADDTVDYESQEFQELVSSGSGFTPGDLEERLKLRLMSLKEAAASEFGVQPRVSAQQSAMSPDIAARFEEEGSFARDSDSPPSSPDYAGNADVTGRPSVRVVKDLKLVSESLYVKKTEAVAKQSAVFQGSAQLGTVFEVSEHSAFDESDMSAVGGGFKPSASGPLDTDSRDKEGDGHSKKL